MKAKLFSGLLFMLSLGVAHAAFDIDTLMNGLAAHPGGRAEFVEKRYAALLDKPVVSKGEMTYTAPGRLEKRTTEPKAESMILDGDTLTLERGQRKMTIQLSSRPEARAFVDSIRSTLSGNRLALEKNYALQLSGHTEDWKLVLTPTESKISALLKRINVSGSGRQIRELEYLQIDDDRTVMQIKPVSTP
jgi:hypothetical protein